MKVFFCSTNQKKIADFGEMFDRPFEVLDVEIDEIQGDEETIALEKIKSVLNNAKEDGIYVVDDVSVSFKALNGFPGPYIKYFLKVGTKTIFEILRQKNCTDATVQCTLGVGIKTKDMLVYKVLSSQVKGSLVKPEEDDFNRFDGIFVPENTDRILKDNPESNKISHRALAIEKLKKFLNEFLPGDKVDR
ncbi:Nucleoside triphosphatase Ham1 [Spraguea lophii 42_110]|uniref:Nucleoside triphosphatase Ham1 n=1 Tax=Spraguea lophii (strain 42_110) TaxID=1358809 RepID=S7W9E6_SPRLO|nr:Nucleoside triphosphatase Ham1 [Spraguea lophii 42_110]